MRNSDAPLVRAALERSRLQDVRAALENDFPVGAGLGGSSAASAALLTSIARWRHKDFDRADVAEEGRRIEVEELGVAGGRQDHYAATHGGALALSFSSRVDVRRIPMSADARRRLAEQSILVYTGESRISGDTITAVLDAYARRERRVVDALRRMKEIAEQMAATLGSADIDGVGALLSEHWAFQRSLHPTIPTARIDEIVEGSRKAGALGAKAMGASGGGCVLVMSPASSVDRVRSAVGPLGQVLDFEVDMDGVVILKDAA